MSAFETATRFFHNCETLQGWDACKALVAEGASFAAQCEPLVDVHTVEGYVNWWTAVGGGPLVGCRYVLNASGWDESSRTALFFGTLHAAHTGEGGPVPPTGKATVADYVYALRMDTDGRVAHMTKVWNAPWSLRELGWG